MSSITQQKKRQQIMLMVLGLVIFLIAAVLIWGFSRGGEASRDAEEELVSGDIISEAARAIIRDISIPHDFFKDNALGQFSSYEPIIAPDEQGRVNPFAPLTSE